MEYVLICAPVGTGERQAVDKIVKELGATNVTHVNVEDGLRESPGARLALQNVTGYQMDEKQPLDIRRITEDLPRDTVTALWREQLRLGLQTLANASSDFRILSCHLILYGHVRGEFYSPLDIPALLNIHGDASHQGQPYKPTHVLLLLDDVYDMYLRLSHEPEANSQPPRSRPLYSRAAFLDYLNQAWLAAGNEGEEGFSELARDYLEFRWQLSGLSQLLAWRHSEAVMAENLATQLGAKFMAVSIKQLTAMPVEWLKDKNTRSVYLSHPISKSRHNQSSSSTGEWDDFVPMFNKLQALMLREQIPCIMPTGIDEFRFETRKEPSGLMPVVGPLGERWPLPTTHSSTDHSRMYSLLMYEPPEGSMDCNHRELFGDVARRLAQASDTPEGHAARVLLQAFIDQITFNVSARDHLLVAHADAILVYRPLYSSNDFAGGVLEELVHSYKRGKRPRVACVHFHRDVVDLLNDKDVKQDMEVTSVRDAAELISKQFRIARQDADRMVKQGTNPKQISILRRPSGQEETILPQVSKYIALAREEFVWFLLTRSDRSAEQEKDIGLWIVEDEEEMEHLLPEIATFLEAFRPKQPHGWKEKLSHILQNTV